MRCAAHGGAFSCCVPRPSCSPVRQCTSLISPSDSFGSRAGRGGGGGRRPPSRSHPVRGGAAVPRQLCPLQYRHSPTSVCGPLPGLVPPPGRDPGPSPRPGAPSWAMGVYTPSCRAGVRGPAQGHYCHSHHHRHRVHPVGCQGARSCCHPPSVHHPGSSQPQWQLGGVHGGPDQKLIGGCVHWTK